jgi:hypothetical protein
MFNNPTGLPMNADMMGKANAESSWFMLADLDKAA